MSDLVPGVILASQFRIVRELGAGGMGAVYVAEQLGMDREVVVKVMHADLTTGQKAVERFKREARAVAALNHPNIVMVFTFGQTEHGQLFQAMELIDGRDLASEIKRAPLDEARALAVVDQVLQALIEAHSHGIVHRDLKPENIMLTARYGNPDHVKVLDFGIAKTMDRDADQPALTKEGAVFGTPRYMAPEQVRGRPVDQRTDLYPLGLVLYEMLTGAHPFGARAPLDYMVAHVNEPIAPPPGVSEATRALLAKALAKEPNERFQSAREMRDAVRAALPRAAPAKAVLAASRVTERRARWPWLALGVALLGGGVALALVLSNRPARDVVAMTREPTEDPGVALTDPPEDQPDAAPEEPSPEHVAAPIPHTDVAPGDDIEGFPSPADARITGNDSMRVQLEAEVAARALIGFYRAELAERGWKTEPMPNGLKVLDQRSPFASVYLLPVGNMVNIQLQRRLDGPSP